MNTQFSTFKFFLSPEKEEAWLKTMAQSGWFLKKVSSFYSYTFERGEPEDRIYKIDYRSLRNSSDREDYLSMFHDSGWQPVVPRDMNGAFYFHNSQSEASRDIFSDEVSRAERNLRYATLFAYSFFPALLPLFVLYLSGNVNFKEIGYLTPGLWEMTGPEFTFHFLFETPFVIMRAGAYFLPVLIVLFALTFYLRYLMLYRKAVRQQAI